MIHAAASETESRNLLNRLRSPAALLLLIAVVMAVYWPIPSKPGDNTLYGWDYLSLHMRRIRYAQEALAAPGIHVPGWYSRELMGTPFWANIQNFPFIPTRLILLMFDPLKAYAAGVEIAAVLAAIFTFLYCRETGMSRWAAWVAGFTFACAGFFASRVMIGHLPLLEAYPAAPLLLWLIERCARARQAGQRVGDWLLALGLTTAMVSLAGHPQIPLYALVLATIYAGFRCWGRFAVVVIIVMGLGAGCAAFALLPMAELVRLSTRMLHLDPPVNDIPFPYGRLKAFFLPWRDGWPAMSGFPKDKPFRGYPNDLWFWDTVCYVGWLPMVATALLLIVFIYQRRWVTPRAHAVILAVGIGALITALPFVTRVMHATGLTLIRSPSRQLYVTSFAMAIAAGCAVDLVLRSNVNWLRKWAVVALLPCLGLHVWDLGSHDRNFVKMIKVALSGDTQEFEQAKEQIGDGRVAIDFDLRMPFNREIDDIGYFDSIALSRPYEALLDLSQISPTANVEFLSGSELSERALRFAGVKLVMTKGARNNPNRIVGSIIPHTAERAAFFPDSRIARAARDEIHRVLRDPKADIETRLLLSLAAPRVTSDQPPASAAIQPPQLVYSRPSSDEIIVDIASQEPGYLRIVETFHPGWSAEVDGIPQPIEVANDTFLAVPIMPGTHRLHLEFSTPGALVGRAISVTSLILLLIVCFRMKRAN